MTDEWIIVPNWDKFQHYKDRDAPWIKLYRELLHKREFLDLTAAERGLLLVIWLEYASSNGRVTVAMLSRYGRLTITKRAIDSLRQAGFIALSASEPLALRALAEKDLLRKSKNALAREPTSVARASAKKIPNIFELMEARGWND